MALPLSQSGTQLCASHSARHYLVTAAASLGLPETKSSQSQLSLLLNSFLFSAMHLLEHFFSKEKNKGRKIKEFFLNLACNDERNNNMLVLIIITQFE